MKKIKIKNEKELDCFVENIKRDIDRNNRDEIEMFSAINSKLEVKPRLLPSEVISFVDTVVDSIFVKATQDRDTDTLMARLSLTDLIKFKVMLTFYTNIEINDFNLISTLLYKYGFFVEFLKEQIDIRQYADLIKRLNESIDYQKQIYLKEYMSTSDMMIKSFFELIDKAKDIGEIVTRVLEDIEKTIVPESRDKMNEVMNTLVQLATNADSNKQNITTDSDLISKTTEDNQTIKLQGVIE